MSENKNILWFFHMPRTGGTSIDKYKVKNSNIYSWGHSGWSQEREDELKELGNLKKFTVLRDPVKHCVSYYTFIRKNRHHQHNKLASKMPFSKWLEKEENIHNYYAKVFQKDKNIDGKIEFFKNMDYVLNTSNLTKEFNYMLKLEGYDANFNIKSNSSSNSVKIKVTQDDINLIKEIRSLDYQILEAIDFKY